MRGRRIHRARSRQPPRRLVSARRPDAGDFPGAQQILRSRRPRRRWQRPGLGRNLGSYAVGLTPSLRGAQATKLSTLRLPRDGLLRFARNDVETYSPIPAARFRPSCASTVPPSKIEGAGNAGCALHPRSRVPKLCIKAHTSIQGSGNTPTSPAQWLYGLYRAPPGGAGLLSPSPAETSHKLSASITAPGPHDFAVRFGVFVRR